MISEEGFMVSRAITAEAAKAVAERVAEFERHVAALEEQVRDLTLSLAVETSNVHGLIGELRAWKQQHPTSPLLAKDRYRHADGSGKTISRAIFETEFDRKARELGISNPREYRHD